MTINSARQLKDKIHNISREKNIKSEALLRIYTIERLLERISASEFRDSFVLKGGILIAALVGIEIRTTMDMDITIKGHQISRENIEETLQKIISVDIGDNMKFEIQSIKENMQGAKYPGFGVTLVYLFDGMRTHVNIDISRGDVITPGKIIHQYKLLLENKTIPIWSYPIETIFAEKLHAVFDKATSNSRMKDFYDIYTLTKLREEDIDIANTAKAFKATSLQRGVDLGDMDFDQILRDISDSKEMHKLWLEYQKKFPYASDITWNEAVTSVRDLCHDMGLVIEDDLSL